MLVAGDSEGKQVPSLLVVKWGDRPVDRPLPHNLLSIKVDNLTKCSEGVVKVGNWAQGGRGDTFHGRCRIPTAI